MKNQKGITLVALIITIIVMLILVGVTLTILINSNVIGKAKSATNQTERAYNNESNFGSQFNYNGTMVNIDDDLVNREW